MTESVLTKSPIFAMSADIYISATPREVYSVVSDLPRSGEWSPETMGGEWVSGEPAEVGSVFRGENLRSEDVVAWAPLVRGTWYTEARVIAAEPGRTFRWAMLTHAGENQNSVWGFDMTPSGSGCVLTHHFRMDTPTEGIHKIVSGMDEAEKQRFFDEWGEKLRGDLDVTLQRIKKVIEGR
ncbi:SRPBCC family protein [Haloechinothrix sp. LS1_15]|uniref:SRPBCC family protein n=1 Tax=Haloechinothrix sp. LS1_15 TaxID=2652248 RepID=UPI002946DCC5|nr:SRPBCC family protein [Haloechinothrix sp. LS1_15]MDV6011634.1 SRPBCC family protein [Haloechinothrix sp. LS1_15]